MDMWTIYSKTWGKLSADSVNFRDETVYATNVTRDCKRLWRSAYIPYGDVSAIVPAEGQQ